MAFTLPTFNIPVNIWRHGNAHTNPPDVTAMGNLSPGELAGVNAFPNWYTSLAITNGVGNMWLRLPKGTDIRDSKAPAGPDTCEVAAGSGRFYNIIWVDDIGGGFSNEHRFAQIVGTTWPVPFPIVNPPPPPPPPITDYTYRAMGSTMGVAANNLTVNYNSGTDDFAFVVVSWWGTAGPPTVNGNIAIPGGTETWSGGTTAGSVAIFAFSVTPGANTAVVQFPGLNTGNLQVEVVTGSNYTPLFSPVAVNQGLHTNPTITPGSAGPVAREAYLAAFVTVNEPAVPTWTAPFVQFGAVISTPTGLDTVNLRIGHYLATVSGVYTAQETFVGVLGGWGGVEVAAY